MKKVFCAFLAFMLVLVSVPLSDVFALSFDGGTGTAADPYLVSKADQVDAIRNYMSSYFKITQDIDMSTARSKNWLPIGTNTNPFKGYINGNGKKISNLSIDRADTTYVGMIGYSLGATIVSLNIVNASISGGEYSGSLVGYADSSTVSNCSASGTVAAHALSATIPGYAGGMFGYSVNSTFSNLTSTCTVKSESAGPVAAGGIVGYFLSGTLANCTSSATVSSLENAGGIIGIMAGGEASNCSSACKVSSNMSVGGFVGNFSGGSIQTCTANCEVKLGYDAGGGFVGTAQGGVIDNCISLGSVQRGTEPSAAPDMGGFAGDAQGIQITNCSTSSSVSGYGIAGGFVSTLGVNSQISNCNASGAISITGSDSWAGGFFAYETGQISITNSYTLSSVACEGRSGGFETYYCNKAVFKSCFWYNGTSASGISNKDVAGVYKIGSIRNNYVPLGETTTLTTDFALCPITFTLVSTDNPSVLKINEDGSVTGCSAGKAKLKYDVKVGDLSYSIDNEIEVGGLFTSGAGTQADPYVISSAEQLLGISRFINSCFKLGGNIDLLSQGSWTPLGTVSDPYTGRFDGAGYTISGLTIDTTTTYAGLFGYATDAAFRNVVIDDAYITVGKYSGGLVGYMDGGSVNNCSATGQITTTTSSTVYSGMLVGYMTNGTISNCYAVGDVTSYYAGVFAGYMGGTMTNCYWYNDANNVLSVAKGSSTNLSKIDISADNLLVGQESQGSITTTLTNQRTSGPVVVMPATNFRIYGTPTGIQYIRSSATSIVSIVSGKLVALKPGSSIVTVKFTYSNKKSVLVDIKVTVTASYKVTFNSMGGSSVASVLASPSSLISAPAVPRKTGFQFVGWFKQSTCTSQWVFSTDKVSGNTTLFGKWVVPASGGLKSTIASGTSIKLSWTALPGVTGYEVIRSVSSTFTNPTTKIATGNSYTDIGLITGVLYYYKVRAYVGSTSKSYGAYSTSISVKPVIIAVAKSASYNGISINWPAVTGATYYEVSRATSSTGTFSVVGKPTTCTFANTNLSTGKRYYYRVRAYIGAKKTFTPYSAVVSSIPIPATPKPTVSRISSSSLKVSWAQVAGATKYEVWRSTSSSGTYKLLVTTTYPYYTNSGLVAGTTYYYKVIAYRLVGSSKIYSLWSAVVSGKP